MLHPAEDLYAGALFFSFDRAAEVLHAWRDWTETAPREITSVGRLMQFGDGPEVAELVRGRSFVVIEAAYLGAEADGAELIRPLRDLRPELDTFTIVPPSALGHLHMEPEHPVARLADDGLVGALPAAAIDDLVAVAGPGSGSPLATRRAAPRERRAGDARARLLHARRRAADRHRVGRGDRGAARPRRGRAGAVRGVPLSAAGACRGPLNQIRERVTAQVRRRRDAICAPPFPLAVDRLSAARRPSHRPAVGIGVFTNRHAVEA